MSRQVYRSVIGIGAVIVLLAFAAGRWSVTARSGNGSVAGGKEDAGSQSLNLVSSTSGITDLGNATIENIGEVEFDHGYRLLRQASAEQLSQWIGRLEALPTGPRKTTGIASFFRILAQIDTESAVDLAKKVKGLDAQRTARGAVWAATPEANVAQLARLELGVDQLGSDGGDLVARWSLTDPESASRFAAPRLAKMDVRGRASLVENWAAIDPAAARTWLEQLDPAQQESKVIAGFYLGWLDHDRSSALNQLAEHGGDERFKDAIEEVAQQLFEESPAAATDFALKFANDEQQKAVVDKVVSAVTAIYMSGKAPYSTESVAKWLVTLPPTIISDELGRVVDLWDNEHPEAVETWLASLPTALHDQVAAQYCLQIGEYDRQKYLQTGFQIIDPQLRRKTLREALSKLESPKKARRIVRKTNLSPHQKTELETIIREL